MRTIKLVWIALFVFACGTGASEAQDVKRINNAELKELLKNDEVQLVDIRTPRETSQGIIEGAKIIDFYNPAFNQEIEKLDKSKPIVVYCAVGGRSASASRKLQQMGFEKIYDLKAGIRGWAVEGNPIKK